MLQPEPKLAGHFIAANGSGGGLSSCRRGTRGPRRFGAVLGRFVACAAHTLMSNRLENGQAVALPRFSKYIPSPANKSHPARHLVVVLQGQRGRTRARAARGMRQSPWGLGRVRRRPDPIFVIHGWQTVSSTSQEGCCRTPGWSYEGLHTPGWALWK